VSRLAAEKHVIATGASRNTLLVRGSLVVETLLQEV